MCHGNVSMAHTKQNTRAQEFSSPESVISVRSISASVKEEATKIILDGSSICTWQGNRAVVINREDLDTIMSKVLSVANDGQEHSVSKQTLHGLNAELASLRFQLGMFESQAEKAEYAKKVSENELVAAKKALEHESVKFVEWKSKIEVEEFLPLRKANDEAQKEMLETKKLLAKARSEKNSESMESLREQRDKLALKITSQNNRLQELNSQQQGKAKEARKLEDQISRLSNELNIAKAQASALKPTQPKTFAEAVKTATSANASAVKSGWDFLSAKGKEFLTKAKSSDRLDVKNRLFWTKAALDKAKNDRFRPYQIYVEGLFEDIKMVDHRSRSLFANVVDSILDSISNNEMLLTSSELENLVNTVELSKVKLAKPVAKATGCKNLQEYVDKGFTSEKVSVLVDYDSLKGVAPPWDPEMEAEDPLTGFNTGVDVRDNWFTRSLKAVLSFVRPNPNKTWFGAFKASCKSAWSKVQHFLF